ncbi:3-isopropylmalate dehydratase large subunit [Microbacterium sp. KHB019]|uniref:3-isopropylmalate dehydratase large subunit n=1 Tax=Microbacterium sp. KHB019 TaxID=3129770 RepID=UPI00307A69B3
MTDSKTITEKILARAAGRAEVSAGDYITARADTVVICDLGWPSIGPLFESLDTPVVDPERLVITFDHTAPAETEYAAELHRTWREFCRRQGIARIHDIGDQGISHVLSVQKGYARPGTLLINVDTHANTCGAVGCLSMAMGTDIVSDLAAGWNWYSVPQSIRIELVGQMGPGVTMRDVAQHVMSDIGQDLGSGKALEFVGDFVDRASIPALMTLCNWSRKTEAVAGIVNPSARTVEYVRSRTDIPFEILRSDPGAQYVAHRTYDVGAVEPVVAAPGDPLDTRAVSEVAGTRIHQAFLGSCAGGSIEDFRAAASVLRGRHVAPGVRMIASPGSQETWRVAEEEGLLRDLSAAGVLVTGSTCGACYGGAGVLTGDEVCISTSTENFQGRMGSMSASIFLGSALTVAASALAGEITDARLLATGVAS